MNDAVVFDSVVLARIQLANDINVSWLHDFGEPPRSLDCQRVQIDNVTYFLSEDTDEESQLLIVDLRQSSGFFHVLDARYRVEAFLRLVRAARIAMEPGRQSIPHSWSPFHDGSRLSFYARHEIAKKPARIEIDSHPRRTRHVYAFALSTQRRQLGAIQIDYGSFDAAVRHRTEALLKAMALAEQEATATGGATRRDFMLDAIRQEDKVARGRSIEEWIDLLTVEQRAFVDRPLDRSLRLVGAAGTGKSLSLMLKCLSEFAKHGSQDNGYRVLFLTFSQSTADIASNTFTVLDRKDVLSRWPNSMLKVCTLQTLAYEALRLEQFELEPLTSDGLEGRDWQRLLIDEQLRRFHGSVWPTVKSRCSQRFQLWMEYSIGSPERRRFVDALMNEYACVLEASGVRASADARERYVKQARKPWMMHLDTEEDRRSVLQLYDLFREDLRESRHIGPDQLTADFLVELGTNRWDRIRGRNGYDVVFVDELHLFNRQERMIPHLLVRDPKATPLVVMAYDVKQSVRDTFYEFTMQSGQGPVISNMGLGSTERFELNKSFRYTPEIAKLLEWVDSALPAVGIAEELGEEWTNLSISSSKAPGVKPIICIARDTQEIYSTVFPRAIRRSRHLKSGNQVAVLCLSESLFAKYADAGTYREQFVAITERGEASSVRRVGQRFVFSMPEFVAGLQFDTVYLIEANESEVRQEQRDIGEYRQFVSQVYLGLSRAESLVEIYASRERGGPSRCFTLAAQNGAVDVVAIADLPDVV